MENAFVTGSQVYGKPGPDSDTDLVVMVEPGDSVRLVIAAGGAKFPLRFGTMNLIMVYDETVFNAWKAAKSLCLYRQAEWKRPLTREEAVKIHVDVFTEFGMPDYFDANPVSRQREL